MLTWPAVSGSNLWLSPVWIQEVGCSGNGRDDGSHGADVPVLQPCGAESSWGRDQLLWWGMGPGWVLGVAEAHVRPLLLWAANCLRCWLGSRVSGVSSPWHPRVAEWHGVSRFHSFSSVSSSGEKLPGALWRWLSTGLSHTGHLSKFFNGSKRARHLWGWTWPVEEHWVLKVETYQMVP